MSATTRWNLVVSQDIDQALRQVLATHGLARKGELSRFVEDAVRARILEVEAAAAKELNAGRTETEMDEAIDEALDWARRR